MKATLSYISEQVYSHHHQIQQTLTLPENSGRVQNKLIVITQPGLSKHTQNKSFKTWAL